MEKTDLLTLLRTDPDFIRDELSHSPEWTATNVQGSSFRPLLAVSPSPSDPSEIVLLGGSSFNDESNLLKIIPTRTLIVVSCSFLSLSLSHLFYATQPRLYFHLNTHRQCLSMKIVSHLRQEPVTKRLLKSCTGHELVDSAQRF